MDGLNLGALPLPIELSETLTVNPSLGAEVSEKSVFAGLIALLLIALLFVVVYRFVGIVAAAALAVYCVIVLAIFKAVPIVLTAAVCLALLCLLGLPLMRMCLSLSACGKKLQKGRHGWMR